MLTRGGHLPGPPPATRSASLAPQVHGAMPSKRSANLPGLFDHPAPPVPLRPLQGPRPAHPAPHPRAASWRAAREPPGGVSCSSAPAAAPPSRPPPTTGFNYLPTVAFLQGFEPPFSPPQNRENPIPAGFSAPQKTKLSFVFRGRDGRGGVWMTVQREQTQAGRAFPRRRPVWKTTDQNVSFGQSGFLVGGALSRKEGSAGGRGSG